MSGHSENFISCIREFHTFGVLHYLELHWTALFVNEVYVALYLIHQPSETGIINTILQIRKLSSENSQELEAALRIKSSLILNQLSPENYPPLWDHTSS